MFLLWGDSELKRLGFVKYLLLYGAVSTCYNSCGDFSDQSLKPSNSWQTLGFTETLTLLPAGPEIQKLLLFVVDFLLFVVCCLCWRGPERPRGFFRFFLLLCGVGWVGWGDDPWTCQHG